MMIKTQDGVELKRGDYAYEVGRSLEGRYVPVRGTIHTGSNDISNEDRCWSTWQLCQLKCDKLNDVL